MSKVVHLAPRVLYAPHHPIQSTSSSEDVGSRVTYSVRQLLPHLGLLTSPWGQEKPAPVRCPQAQQVVTSASQRQMETISQAAKATQFRLAQIGKMHRMAANLFARTLADGQTLIQQSARVRPLTLDERLGLSQLRRAFLEAVLTILAEQRDPFLCQGSDNDYLSVNGISQLHAIEQMAEAYLQHVRAILAEQEADDDKERTESVGASTP